MRIGINASALLHKEKTGVEWYVVSLLEYLAKTRGQEKHEFIVYYPDNNQKIEEGYLKLFPSNWTFKAIAWPFKYFWTQLALYKVLKKDQLDLLFIPSHVIPALYKGKSVMTVHDLAFKYFKNAYSKKELKYQDLAIKSAKRKNACFIVPSQQSYEDLVKFYDIKPERIVKVYHGFSGSHLQKDINMDIALQKRYKIPSEYLLTVGRIENKKNTLGIIKSFELFLDKYSEFKNFHLIVTGKPGYGYEKIIDYLNQSRYKKQILHLGHLTRAELSILLKNAKLMLFPSFYEGFGFPILEAMSMGLPVITSNYGVMKEISGDSAYFVDPKNYKDIAQAIHKLLTNNDLYQNLLKKGLQQAELFTWQKAAQESLDAFNKFLSLS